MVKQSLTKAVILSSFPEKAIIQTLQEKGVSVFDQDIKSLSSYERSQKKELMAVFSDLYKSIKL
jgi:chromosome partitioning protein